MKVKDILRQIEDTKLYIEIKQTTKNGGATYGFYTKKELFYNEKYKNLTIKGINAKYYNGMRYLELQTNI